MKLKNIILPSLLVTGALAVGSIGVHIASAQESETYPPIIQRLADRFNLNADDVQDFFEEERAEHEAEILANWEDRLDEAVSEGKITEAQKTAILDKQEEMRAHMDALKNQDLTHKERVAKMKEFHENLRTWAEQEGIDLKELGPFVMKFKGFHRGMHGNGEFMKYMPDNEEHFEIKLR